MAYRNLDWDKFNRVLNSKVNAEGKQYRKKEWQSVDVNGNGIISLAEYDRWLHVKMPEFFYGPHNQYKAAFLKAHNKAKSLSPPPKNVDKKTAQLLDDYVTFEEFRLLLFFTRLFLEFYAMFDEIDTSDDKKISLDEFKAAIPRLNAWGAKISNVEAEFRKIDKNGGGSIIFTEFLDYALDLDLEHDMDVDE